jgi:molybdenum cofactor synthesis domain-containing protein
MEALISVITVSDSRSSGESQDLSGPIAVETLREFGYTLFQVEIVPDEIEPIQSAIRKAATNCRAIFTTGGTGFSPRDVTPEATREMLDKFAPGISELMRLRGLDGTQFSHLSRGVSGVVGDCLVVNLPGSPKAVREGIRAIGHLLPPILESLTGGKCSGGHE